MTLSSLRGKAKPGKSSSTSKEATCQREDTSTRASLHRTVDRNVQDLHFGDYIMGKKKGTIRIGFQNFNGMTGRDHDPVDTSIRNWITDNIFDVFGISEVNLYWPKVKKHLQFQERVSQWWAPGQQRSIFDYNKTEKRLIRSIRQYGGTAQISRGEAIVREYAHGKDK